LSFTPQAGTNAQVSKLMNNVKAKQSAVTTNSHCRKLVRSFPVYKWHYHIAHQTGHVSQNVKSTTHLHYLIRRHAVTLS